MANKDNVRLWVDALRSGQYKQGDGYLQLIGTPNRLCCVGVACEVAIQNGVNLTKKDNGHSVTYMDPDGAMDRFRMPRLVQDWLDIHESGGGANVVADADGHRRSDYDVISLNDSFGFTFENIADALEDTYLKDSDD